MFGKKVFCSFARTGRNPFSPPWMPYPTFPYVLLMFLDYWLLMCLLSTQLIRLVICIKMYLWILKKDINMAKQIISFIYCNIAFTYKDKSVLKYIIIYEYVWKHNLLTDEILKYNIYCSVDRNSYMFIWHLLI